MLRLIDRLLDRVTMYRLLLYYLIALVGLAAVLSQLGYLHYGPIAVLFSATYLVAVCWLSNRIFAHTFGAPSNPESSIITGLILALIITPISSRFGLLFMTAAGGLAIASKYLLAFRKTHIFNPAAMAVVLTAYGAGQSASWWVGTADLLPLVIVGGLLVIRKTRRTPMVAAFVVTAYGATALYTILGHGQLGTALQRVTLSSSLFFLAFVMLTEPLTSPHIRSKQLGYAALVALLFPPQVHFGSFYFTPELALVVGNAFSYLTSPPVKIFPRLKEKIRIAPGIVDFVFANEARLQYQPGQYMEWSLPHKAADARGERRYLTLASSPTEPELRLGVKFYQKGSSYKQALLALSPQTSFVGAQLGGDFTLPKNKQQKLAFIAGGIGITPYRSMLKYLLDTSERRDIALLYAAKSAHEFVYGDVLGAAHATLGTHLAYITSDGTTGSAPGTWHAGNISAGLIRREVPDYAERLFYLSGPQAMVRSAQTALADLGVPRTRIKTDFFPGYS